MRVLLRSIATVCITAACFAPVYESSAKGLPVAAALAIPSVQGRNTVISPDGALIAMNVCDPKRMFPAIQEKSQQYTSTGATIGETGCDIWIVRVDGGAKINVTKGHGANWAPSWSPNSEMLAFYSDRDGAARIWVWKRQTCSLQRLSPAIVHSPTYGICCYTDTPVWSAGGQQIFAPLIPVGENLHDATMPSISGEGAFDHTYSEQANVRVFRYDPHGTANVSRGVKRDVSAAIDLAFISVSTGSVQRLVHLADARDHGGWNAWFEPSPDGRKIAYTEVPRAESSDWIAVFSLKVAGAAGRTTTLVSDAPITGVQWSPDGTMLAYKTLTSVVKGISNTSVFVVNADGMSPSRRLTPLNTRLSFVSSLSWDAESKHVFFCSKTNDIGSLWVATARGDNAQTYSVPGLGFSAIVQSSQTGTVSTHAGRITLLGTVQSSKASAIATFDLRTRDFSILREAAEHEDFVGADGGSRFIVERESMDDPPKFYLADARFVTFRKMVDVNAAVDKMTFGKSRLIEWTTAWGDHLKGNLILPVGYIAGRRYPMIVYIYGDVPLSYTLDTFGAFGEFGPMNRINMQFFATRGYAVLVADTVTHVGTIARDIAASVIPGVKRAIGLGIADPNRLGIMGTSFGGFSVMAVISNTHMFKAAVAEAAPENWTSEYAVLQDDGSELSTGLVEMGQVKMGGTLWQYPNRYVANSPVFLFPKISTPVLLLSGRVDPIVPFTEARQAFVDLRHLGKEVTLAEYDGQGHGNLYYPDRVDYTERIINWFDSHLKR